MPTYFAPTVGNIEKVTSFPYITRAERAGQWGRCNAWSGGIARTRCGNTALYKYEAGRTKKAHAKTGYWCWVHLFREGINYRKYDKERAERAWKKIQETK